MNAGVIAAAGCLPTSLARAAGEGGTAGGAGGGVRGAANRHPLHHLRNRVCLAVLTLLAGCSAGPPPRMILLSNDVALPPATQQMQRPVLVVRTVSMPEYLDRRAIIYRSSDAELKRFPDVVWAERPGESVTRWVALQLAAELPGYEVQAFTTDSEKSPALALNIELQSFEPDAMPETATVLRLRGDWHLSGIAMMDGRLAADAPMGTVDAPSTVVAMRAALTQACDAIAEQIRRLPPVANK